MLRAPNKKAKAARQASEKNAHQHGCKNPIFFSNDKIYVVKTTVEVQIHASGWRITLFCGENTPFLSLFWHPRAFLILHIRGENETKQIKTSHINSRNYKRDSACLGENLGAIFGEIAGVLRVFLEREYRENCGNFRGDFEEIWVGILRFFESCYASISDRFWEEITPI